MKSSSVEKKTILLINPPLYFSDNLPRSLDISLPPLGLLYLATYINKKSTNFKAKIIDIGAENIKLNQINSYIKKHKPIAVCLSAMTPQLQGLYSLAKIIKKRYPWQIIILGGSHISGDPDFIKRHSSLFDYAITGESEISLLKTLEKIKKGEIVPKIQAGKICLQLDDLPIPDRHLIKRHLYQKNESLLFSRGCPFHCYYCSRPAISHLVRYRSPLNLITEIKKTYQYHHGLVDFQDDTFTLRKEPVIGFCQSIIDQKIKLSWTCNTRIDMVDKKLLTLMKKTGCRQINFGVESANYNLRRQVIKKGNFTNQQIEKMFLICQSLKIKVAAYFMIGHPTESKTQINQTLKMILDFPISILGLSIPLPFPGSALYQIAQKEGFISSQMIDDFALGKLGIGYANVYPQYHPSTLSQNYLHQKMRQINRSFYLRPKIVLSNLTNILSQPQKAFLDLISLLKYGMSSRKPYK